MNSSAKNLLLEKARSLLLDAVGCMSCPIAPQLSEKLEKAGPVPFAPAEIEKRLAPEEILADTKSIAVILFPYRYPEEKNANIALYARAKDYHHVVRAYLAKIIGYMEEQYPNEKFHAITDTSPMADRWLAYQAGLGFFGRNHCLIHPKYGSYFTIGAILTTLALPPDIPLAMNCGSCTRCFTACPGKALSHERFNPWRCKSYLTQKKEVLNEEEKNILRKTPLIFGCDECQKCCPFNKNAAYSPLPETDADRIPRLERETLEQISNRRFTKEYGEYAFSWRGRPVLLRNMDIIDKK